MKRSARFPRLGIAGACAAFLLFAGSARSQSDEYVIGVGDVLQVQVWQRPDLSGETVVDSEGNITLPLLGSITAEGVTPRGLGDDLTRRFSLVDRGVSQTNVSVSQYNSRRVFVMGEVLSPGSYSFAQIPGLWEVIREAGGPSAEAVLSRVRVIPPEGRPSSVDLSLALATGDFGGLPAIEAGSTVLVPRGEATLTPDSEVVHVYGSVQAPGSYPIELAGSVLEAILAAGGPRETAEMEQVRVVRPGAVKAHVFTVNLDDYTHDGVLFANMELRPGDTVTIPDARRTVLGRVTDFAKGAGGFLLGAVAVVVAAQK